MIALINMNEGTLHRAMNKHKYFFFLSFFIAFLRSLTLEPSLFLMGLGLALEYGSQVSTNMLIQKVCQFELGQNVSTCAEDQLFRHQDLETAVIQRVNQVRLVQTWIATAPGLIYTLLTFGIQSSNPRHLKAMLILPMVFTLVSHLVSIVHYAFLEELPTEFFYLGKYEVMLACNQCQYLNRADTYQPV